ncbi:MAG TPA: UrcA family protein [Steroidobacteraceae bacterium]
MFAALTSSIAAVSFASDSTDPLQVKVKYADLNVSSTSGAATLYSRIRNAARIVCRPFESAELASKKHLAACVDKAMNNAIAEINQPALFTVAKAKAGTSKPMLLASGQVR